MSAPPAVERRVVVLAAQRAEIQPLRRLLAGDRRLPLAGLDARVGRCGPVEVVTVVTGEGRRAARSAAVRVHDAQRYDEVLIVGVAGALNDTLPVGAIITATEVREEGGGRLVLPPTAARSSTGAFVLTVDRIVGAPEERRRLVAAFALGATPAVVDMESFDLVEVALKRGLPVVVLRAVSDGPSDTLPAWLGLCRDRRGRISRSRVAARLALHPADLPVLLRLGRRVAKLSEELAQRVYQRLAETPFGAPGKAPLI